MQCLLIAYFNMRLFCFYFYCGYSGFRIPGIYFEDHHYPESFIQFQKTMTSLAAIAFSHSMLNTQKVRNVDMKSSPIKSMNDSS